MRLLSHNSTPPPVAVRVTLVLLGLIALNLLGVAATATLISGNGLMAFIALPAFWPFATAVGIARRHGWARISMLLFAMILSALAALGLFSDLLAVTLAFTGKASDSAAEAILAPLWLGLLGIGVWWLVYFTRPATRILFAPKP